LWLLNDGDDIDDNNNKIIIGLELDKAHSYGHTPKPREKCYESKVTKLYNQPRKRSTRISTSKPDTIIHEKDRETCLLRDISIAGDTNVKKKDAKQILKI